MPHTLHTIPNSLQQIFKESPQVIHLPKGAYVFQEGSDPKELYLIKKGKVTVSKLLPDNRELTIRMCSRNDIVGELLLFSPNPTYMLHAKVIEDSELAVVTKEELENKLTNNHEAALDYMKWISIHYRRTQTKIRDLLLHGKKGALYSTIIRFANSYGVNTTSGITLSITLTNRDLAGFCGTSREVINRMLSELKIKKVLSIEKGLMTIHDLAYLKSAINCEGCPLEICCIE